jgi:hypothetical protein
MDMFAASLPRCMIGTSQQRDCMRLDGVSRPLLALSSRSDAFAPLRKGIPTAHTPSKSVLLHLAQQAKHAMCGLERPAGPTVRLSYSAVLKLREPRSHHGQYCPLPACSLLLLAPPPPDHALASHHTWLGSQTAKAPRPCTWRCCCQFEISSLELEQSARWFPQHPSPGPGQLSSLPQHGLPPPSAVVSALCSPVLSLLLLLFLAGPLQPGYLGHLHTAPVRAQPVLNLLCHFSPYRGAVPGQHPQTHRGLSSCVEEFTSRFPS